MATELMIGLGSIIIGVLSIIVAIVTVVHSNRNSRQQTIVVKLEELYEEVQSLGMRYDKLKELTFKVEVLRDANNKELQTLDQYYAARDKVVPQPEREKIFGHIARLEVLTNCYTKKELHHALQNYISLMIALSDLAFHAGSVYQEVHWKNVFPDYEKFFTQTEELKKQITAEVKKLFA